MVIDRPFELLGIEDQLLPKAIGNTVPDEIPAMVGAIRALVDLNWTSGAIPAELMIRIVAKYVVNATGPIDIWIDTEELSWAGKPATITSTITNLIAARSVKGRTTRIRGVFRSLIPSLPRIVDAAERESVVQPIDEIKRAQISSVRAEIDCNAGTERQIFQWLGEFEEGSFSGSGEFKAIPSGTEMDRIIITIRENESVEEAIAIQSIRQSGQEPFSGIGTVIPAGSLAGIEIEKLMWERFSQAGSIIATTYPIDLAHRALRIWGSIAAD